MTWGDEKVTHDVFICLLEIQNSTFLEKPDWMHMKRGKYSLFFHCISYKLFSIVFN